MKEKRSPIWVYPNASSLGLGAVLVGMWYGGASQNNGAAYLLCFLLTALTLVAIPNTWANLRGVDLKAETIRPVFAGEEIRLGLIASTSSRKPRRGLAARSTRANSAARFGFIQPGKAVHAELSAPAPERGMFRQIRIRLTSQYPFGFITASRQFDLAQTYYVYPQPRGSRPLPMTFDPARDTREGIRAEGDDYAGVRSWIPGESMRHIDWKAVSRGHPLMTKQWTSEAGHRLVLNWNDLVEVEPEARLSQLARWVIDAENQALDYGLQLPRLNVQPSRGEQHYHRCLRALAIFGRDPQENDSTSDPKSVPATSNVQSRE